jgi:hypothetical protein
MELMSRVVVLPASTSWVAPLLGLFAVVVTPTIVRARYALPRAPRPLLWDIPRVAQIYTTVVGSLAGFASASLVFVARAGLDRPHPEFESMMALLLVAFLALAAAAMEFGNTPNADGGTDEFRRVQRLTFLVANVTLTQGICVSWLALRSVTLFAGLEVLSNAFAALMVLVVVMAGVRITQYLFDLTTACAPLCLVTPVLAMGAAGAYLLGLVPLAPWLAPGEHASVAFALVVALVALAGFGLQATIFSLQSAGVLDGRLGRYAEYAAVAHSHLAATSICLVAIVVIWR